MKHHSVLIIARTVIALVWLYQGLWCKLIAADKHHAVVAVVPGLGGFADLLLPTLGVVEVMLALWVLSGWRPILVTAAQTTLVVAMNIAGLGWARQHIADPAGMVVMNIAFLTLVWMTAREATSRRVPA